MKVLAPAVAGTFYPRDREGLRAEVDRLLDVSGGPPAALDAPVRAAIAPHAGYVYSGGVAARAFSPFRDAEFDRVLLLGPSHHFGFRGAVVPEAKAYRTPLGDVPLDLRALAALAGAPSVTASDRPFEPEHALEVELPFLQRLLRDGWTVVPLLVGGPTPPSELDRIAESLRPFVDTRTLVVVSSDFTHYGERFGYVPFRDRIPERIEALDLGAVRRIEEGDAAGFAAYCDETGATICGRNAIAILLRLAPGVVRGALLEYDTSGRATGDWTHTVSYAALGVSLGAA